MAQEMYTGDMLVGQIIKQNPANIGILESYGMGCAGCPASQTESLKDACMVHGISVEPVLAALNAGA